MFFNKILILCASLSLLAHKGSAAQQDKEYTTIKDQSNLPILTPLFSERKTKKIQLENGLQALLISDPKEDVSGAMLSVKAGSWEDPSDHPGLAHFLEHMLFLGTSKYPKESEFQNFVIEHGGQTNAFTRDSSTSYLFTVDNKAFSGALDRFSSFFKDPLFNPSGVSREIHAINQEFAKNKESDDIREIYVLKALADPRHPFHHFTTGDSETLANTKRETLEEWFRSHYSANLMKLVAISALPLEEMTRLIVKDFSGIPNRNRQPLTASFPAFKSSEEGKFVYINPIKNVRSLMLVWDLPEKFSHMKEAQPDLIVSYILGYEGEKSLLTQLKREDLAEGVSAGSTKIGDDLVLFFLQIDLTQEGLKDIDQVISRCFQAIKNIEEKGVPPYLFDEIKKMETIQYQYQSKQDEFAQLMKDALEIQDEDISTFPVHSRVIQQFNPQEIKKLLHYLTPQNALYLVMAPTAETGIVPDQKEKWMGVEYAVKPIPSELIDKWKSVDASPQIDLPPPNIFIPDNLKLVHQNFTPSDKLIPRPFPIVRNEKSEIYFALDDKFGMPKVSWSFQILTPEISMDSALKIAYADLLVKSLKNDLNSIAYPAKMAGLDYKIKREKNGIRVDISGYSQNAPRLLKEVLQTMKNYKPKPETFKILKEALFRKYQNFCFEKPFEQSLELFKTILYEEYPTEKEKATALRKVSFKNYSEYAAKVFNKTYVKGILYGNMTKEEAEKIVSDVNQSFNKGIYPKKDHLKDAVIVLPQNSGPYYLESVTKAQGNAVLLAIENDRFSFKERASQQILMQGMKEPFFDALRTKQQTGYLVFSFPEEIERKLFNLFTVQSSTHDVRDLLARFEEFIEEYVLTIGHTSLTEKEFHNICDALVKKYEHPAKSIVEMGKLLATLTFDYDADFDWIQKRLQGFRTLTYDEFQTMAKEFIGKGNKRRLAILLKGEVQKETVFSYTRARTWSMLRKVSQYQFRENSGQLKTYN